MSITYKKKQQKLWSQGKIEDVYVAKVSYNLHLNEYALAEEISEKTTASIADVMLVLTALEDCISANVARGNVVKMDLLGSFYPSIKAKAVSSPDEVNQFSITGKGVKFTPSKSFKERIQNAGVKLYSNKVYPAEPHAQRKKDDKNSKTKQENI